jgi:hypothetical protein
VITAAMTQARSITANFAVDQYTLTVNSPYGGAYPGTLTTNNGTALNEWITNSPLVSGTTQYICMGAAVSGNGEVDLSGVRQLSQSQYLWIPKPRSSWRDRLSKLSVSS